MKFTKWLEQNGHGETMNAAMLAAPGSAEVIRSGLQPQVDGKSISTTEKKHQDLILALDTKIQQIKTVKIPKDAKKLRHFLHNFLKKWEEVKLGHQSQQDVGGLGGVQNTPQELDYLKRNQPLPEAPKMAVAGIFGSN